VHHVIVEGENHERGISDNAAEDAGVHGVEVPSFGVDGSTQTGNRFVQGKNRSIRHDSPLLSEKM
jgi:hypothetical protein